MAFLNKVMLIGRLTDHPEEPRTLPSSGNRVVKFRFAVGRSRKNEQGQWENDPNPLYIDCEAYSRPDQRRDLVNLISQYCKKGDQLYIEGRLQLDQWEDKSGGGKRSKHKVVVEAIEFLNQGAGGEAAGPRESGSNYSRSPSRPPHRAPQSPSAMPDDLPPASYNDDPGGDDNIPF